MCWTVRVPLKYLHLSRMVHQRVKKCPKHCRHSLPWQKCGRIFFITTHISWIMGGIVHFISQEATFCLVRIFFKYFQFYHWRFQPRHQGAKRRVLWRPVLENPILRSNTSTSKELRVHTPLQVVCYNITMPQPVISDRIPSTNFVFLAPSRFPSPKVALRRRCTTHGSSCFNHKLLCNVGIFHRDQV